VTKNIVLIGMMGSGKSMVAQELSRRLNRPACSTDAWVEGKTKASVKDIVAAQGWPHFRCLEAQAVADLARQQGIIIDCGGGVVLDPKNLEILRNNGIIFHLDAPPSVIYGRIKDDASRPLINVPNPLAELEKIYAQRLPLYAQADFTIDASDPSIEGPVVQICAKA
jgi:shikimate kinase